MADKNMDAAPIESAPRRRFSVHVAWTLLARVLMTINSVAAGILVARLLGAEELGQLLVINVAVSTIVQLGSAGLPSANTYFIALDKKHLAPAAVSSLVFALTVGGLLALGLTGLATWQPLWFGQLSPRLIGIAALSIPFQLITLVGLNIFLAIGQVGRFNLLDLVGQSFVLINALVALIIFNAGLWLLVSLNTGVSAALGIMIVLLVAVYGARRERGSWRFDWPLFKRMMSYGLKFHVAIVAGALIFRADLFVVNYFRGEAEAAVYGVASQVAMMLMMLPGIIATLLFPRATAEQEKRVELICRVTRHTTFIMLLICLLSVPLTYLLPLLYGPAFHDAAAQVLILLPGVFLIGIESVLVQYFSATGQPATVPLFWIITLAVNVSLTFALVPRLGARGAALSSAISYMLISALVIFYFRARTGKNFSSILLLRAGELRALLKTKTT